ncbi:HWE histidine kinase domain-containing protein [Methylocystis sp.]|uniref:sensor histidine kinase n=1 Tax=Methylocystis sp. TaxID=1911079 RepID=UPI0025E31472|nr:HWE histidine kinase domain-containing protein [Methylocystis sp.]
MKLERRQDSAISDVFITEELDRRAPKETDSLREKLALQDLAGRMADHPAEVLPRFVDLAMEMTGGVSAGLSLYEPDPAPGVFRWRYLRGRLAPFEDATTPRNFSPCGVTLDRNAPVLSSHPERVYDWISDAGIVVPEVLLVPLYLGGKEPLGTLWIVSDKEGHFDSGHARVMTELAGFVGIALRMLNSERRLKEALEQQERLTSEMSHRVKNLFALTTGIVRVSEKAAKTPAEMSKMVSGRLDALAEADALVRRSFANKAQAEMVDLAELVAKIMQPHAPPDTRSHFVAEGPRILLGQRATNGLALVLHEFATNAAKYGALKSEEGVVELSWSAEGEQLVLCWSERGGPKIARPPESSGFGTRLSQSTIVSQFEGELGYRWRPEGLMVSMKIPLANLSK